MHYNIQFSLSSDDLAGDDKSRESFVGAAYIMSQFSHKNVLPLLGIITSSTPLMAVFPYASLGDLKHFLTRLGPSIIIFHVFHCVCVCTELGGKLDLNHSLVILD